MAKSNSKVKKIKKTPLQQEFDKRKKSIDKILKELGKDERLKKPEKLTKKYVDSLSSINKKKLKSYYSGTLSKSASNIISRRLTNSHTQEKNTARNIKFLQFSQSQEKQQVIIYQGNFVDPNTGEILDIYFDSEEFEQVSPLKYEQYLENKYPTLNIVNTQQLVQDYISYIDIAKERFEQVFDSDGKGANILKHYVSNRITEYGETAFYDAIANMDDEFWEAIDIVANYGDDGEQDNDPKEYRINMDLIIHKINYALGDDIFE